MKMIVVDLVDIDKLPAFFVQKLQNYYYYKKTLCRVVKPKIPKEFCQCSQKKNENIKKNESAVHRGS